MKQTRNLGFFLNSSASTYRSFDHCPSLNLGLISPASRNTRLHIFPSTPFRIPDLRRNSLAQSISFPNYFTEDAHAARGSASRTRGLGCLVQSPKVALLLHLLTSRTS